MLHLESGLLSREITKATTVGRATSSAAEPATSATTTATEIASATTTTTSAKATTLTAAAASTKATARRRVTVLRARLAVVQADRTVLDVSTLHGLKCSCSFFGRREGNVPKALGSTGFTVSGKANTHHGSMGTERIGDILLGAVERKVAQEQGVARLAGLVSIRLATVVLSVSTAGTSVGKVHIHDTAIKFGALLRAMSFGSIDSADEFNVPKTMFCQ